MGHWGTGISSNDTFMEVYETYFHYYNHNLSVDEIKKQLESDFAGIIASELTSNDYWFALAKALWECKELDTTTFAKVKDIIENKLDLKVWKELEAPEKDLLGREKALDKFLITISTDKQKAKARKKIIQYSGIYDKGVCIAVKMTNGNYGGLLVLVKENDTLTGENVIAATNINSPGLPQVSDFKNAKILTGRHKDDLGYNREYYWIFVLEAKRKRYNKQAVAAFTVVGTLPVERVFEKYFTTPYHYKDEWLDIIKVVEDALSKIAGGEKENISATVEEWIIPQ
jgi:hypothetical protein